MMDFHFLRPLWFLALLPLAALLWLYRRRRLPGRSWSGVVDSALLPYMLIADGGRERLRPVLILGVAGLLAVTALAGPVWRKLEQPVFQRQSSLVVLLDLSRSMDAGDLKPSRLERARQKLHDILKRRDEGQTALIAYAADAFVVSPLTTDGKTIAGQLGGLGTGLMPAQGSRPDRAVAKARQLLAQAGAEGGAVLLITDGVEGAPAPALEEELRQLETAGHRLLILGAGTPGGAPIPHDDGGFVTDTAGSIVLPRLDAAALDDLARRGGGLYRPLSVDDSDIDALLRVVDGMAATVADKPAEDMKSGQWREEGPWLLLPLLLLASLVFRRGYLVLAVVLALPVPRSGYAMDWDGLWLRDDQRARQALADNQPARAAELFQDPAWRAAARYRSGDYQGALQDLEGLDTAEALYNRGNALARLNRFPEALSAYDEALKRNPSLADAGHNRDLVKRWLEQDSGQNARNQEGDNESGTQQQGEHGKDQGKPGDQQGQGEQTREAGGEQGDGQGDDQGGEGQAGPRGSREKEEQGSGTGDAAEQRAGQEPSASEEPASTGDESSRAGTDGRADGSTDGREDASTGNAAPPGDGVNEPAEGSGHAATRDDVSQEALESEQATEQWLRRIPDDPAGLWRRKFLYQYQQQGQNKGDEEKPW